MTLPFRGAVTAKPTEGFCKDLTVSSSVRGGSREKIKIHITNRKTSRGNKKRSKENKIKIYPQKVEKGEINNI